MFSTMTAAALEKLIAQCLKLDPETAAVARQLSGKVVAIELRGPGLEFFLSFSDDAVAVLTEYDGQPNARVSGTPLAMLRMGLSGHDRNSLFSGDVEISGDIDVGKRVRALVDGLDIDWEEQLSRVVGDVLAHQAGNVVRGLRDWAEQSLDTLQRDTGEYLREESLLLARREEVEAYLSEVDRLRNDVERLELRLRREQSRRQGEAR